MDYSPWGCKESDFINNFINFNFINFINILHKQQLLLQSLAQKWARCPCDKWRRSALLLNDLKKKKSRTVEGGQREKSWADVREFCLSG